MGSRTGFDVPATPWLRAMTMATSLAAVLATSSCTKSEPPVAARLAQALWHQPPGRRVKGENEYTYYPEVAGLNGAVRVGVRYDDESARLLHVRCLGSDDTCPVNELAPHRQLLRSQAGSREPERYYRLVGGPLDGCVQLAQSPSSVDVATPAYAKAEWSIVSGTSGR